MITDADGKYNVSAVRKTMHILEAVASADGIARLAKLSRGTGIPKATLFRYLTTLEQMRFVRKDPLTGGYELDWKLFELGSRVAMKHGLRETVMSEMHSLLDRFSETVNFAMMDDGQVLYLEMLESPQALKMSARTGSRGYAHSTSLGKAMLAHTSAEELVRIVEVHGLPSQTESTIKTLDQLKKELRKVKDRGYASDRGENEPMVGCVGAAILNHFGSVEGALSISGPLHRMSGATMEEMGQALTDATSRISRTIRRSSPNQ